MARGSERPDVVLVEPVATTEHLQLAEPDPPVVVLALGGEVAGHPQAPVADFDGLGWVDGLVHRHAAAPGPAATFEGSLPCMPVGYVLTQVEAAWILGCSRRQVARLIRQGRLPGGRLALTLEAVEQLATELYPWRAHVHDVDSYWVTGQDAAAVLGVSRQRLDQLAAADRLPYVVHIDGVRLYRRAQLEVLARR